MSAILKVPRNYHDAQKPYWVLVREHGKSRKSMVDFICGIGGYSNRDGRWAIEFNVTAMCNLDLDYLRDKLIAGWDGEHAHMEPPPPEERTAWLAAFTSAYNKLGESHLWAMARDSAWEGFEASVGHLWDGDAYDVEVSLRGQGGKHLVLEQVDGYSLEVSTEQLELALMERGDGAFHKGESPFVVPLAKVIAIFKVCVQLSVGCTTKRIADELEYQALSRLVIDAEGEYEELKDTEALSKDAQEIVQFFAGAMTLTDVSAEKSKQLLASLAAICKRAGVSYGEA